MTKDENYWIDKCRSYPGDYVIMVDNDCAFVVDIKKDEVAFYFDNYGWQLALDLFRYIGCNAEDV